MASKAENVFIWWRHHVKWLLACVYSWCLSIIRQAPTKSAINVLYPVYSHPGNLRLDSWNYPKFAIIYLVNGDTDSIVIIVWYVKNCRQYKLMDSLILCIEWNRSGGIMHTDDNDQYNATCYDVLAPSYCIPGVLYTMGLDMARSIIKPYSTQCGKCQCKTYFEFPKEAPYHARCRVTTCLL